jgi:hypothetical protein
MKRTVLFLVLASCSEAADGARSTPGADASVAEVQDSGADPARDAIAPIGDAASKGGVVINEISGKGSEWVELYNAGATAVDLSGFQIADGEKDAGTPKLSEAALVPQGTILSPRSYLVATKMSADASAPSCPDGGESYCLGFRFGISNSEGDVVYLIAPGGVVAERADYPAGVVGSNQTWGRSPNGTGAFQITAPTPGASNP